jgi:hypothetical protein
MTILTSSWIVWFLISLTWERWFRKQLHIVICSICSILISQNLSPVDSGSFIGTKLNLKIFKWISIKFAYLPKIDKIVTLISNYSKYSKMQYSIVELTVLYMVMSCLTYIQGFSLKVTILSIFGKYANFIEIHLKILRFNFVPINDHNWILHFRIFRIIGYSFKTPNLFLKF